MKNFLRYFMLLLVAVFAGNKGFATDVVFDFSTENGIKALGIAVPAEGSNTDIAGTAITYQNVTLTSTDAPNANSTRVWQSSGNSAGKFDLRAYTGATLTFTVPTGKVITKIVCTDSSAKKWDSAPSANVGTFSDHTWTGSANSVTFTMSAQNRFGTITVTYGDDDGSGGGDVTPPGPDPGTDPSGEITFDFDKDNDVLTLFGFEGYSSSPETGYVDTGDFKESKTGTVEGVELTVSPNPASLDGGKDTPNRVWGKSPKLRLYGGTMTVKAPAGHKFTAMTFTSAWNSKGQALYWSATANTGTLTVGDMNNQTVVWAGEAEEVVFTIEKNTQLKKLVVTLDGEAPDFKPVISGTTPFDEETTVTITPLYEDDVIYYTTDGTDPTTASTLYRGPFTINATTTVKAVEEDAISGDLSEVVEMVFTKNVITYETVNPPYTETLQGSYGKFQIEGTKTAWKTNNFGAVASAKNASTMLVSPFINLTNANTPKLSFEHQGRFFTTPAEEAMLCVREEGGEWQTIALEYPEAFTGKDWTDFTTVEKDLTAYKGKTVQFAFKYVSGESYGAWEIKNFTVQDGDIVVTYQDETIESLNGKTSTAIDRVNLKLNNALVVYVDANQGAYVREGDYAIQFFKTALALRAGMTLTGDIKLAYSPYHGLPETKDIEDVTTIEGVTTGTGEVAPVETTLEELIALKHLADLVVVKGVTLSSETTGEGDNQKTNYYMNLGENKVQIFDKYGLDIIPTEIDETKKYDVTGIFGTIYNNAPEIFPTVIEESTGTGIKCVETLNAETLKRSNATYNLSGQRVNSTYHGIVIKNGKKFVQK